MNRLRKNYVASGAADGFQLALINLAEVAAGPHKSTTYDLLWSGKAIFTEGREAQGS